MGRPEEPRTPSSEDGSGAARRTRVLVAVLVAVFVIALVVAHLTGVIGPGSH